MLKKCSHLVKGYSRWFINIKKTTAAYVFCKCPMREERYLAPFLSFLLFYVVRWIHALCIAFKRVLFFLHSCILLWENEKYLVRLSRNTAYEGDDDRWLSWRFLQRMKDYLRFYLNLSSLTKRTNVKRCSINDHMWKRKSEAVM